MELKMNDENEILVEGILNAGESHKPLTAMQVAVPIEVINAVKAAPLTKFGESIDESSKSFSNQILKYDWLTINAKGRMVLTNFSVPWIAIAVKNLSIENAPTINDKAIILRALDSSLEKYVNGANRDPYPSRARDGADGSGQEGGSGAEGVWGGDGLTVHTPKIFFFSQNIDVATQDPPAGGVHIRIIADGPKGGNGGNGGPGQDGGHGGSGTSSQCRNVTFPINHCYECVAGPGDGGRGGNGGIGGRGGAAAAGGNAGDVWFIGPKPDLAKTGYFGVAQKGGAPGNPGLAGGPGKWGGGGGGGYQCKCCTVGGGSKGDGTEPTPSTRGPGPVSALHGVDGDTFRLERNNGDLWP